MMIGAMQALTDLGLSCPGDVSLAGIDDFPWAAIFAPRLTTQKQPIEALADHAVQMPRGAASGRRGAVRGVVLPSDLIVRELVCAARSGGPPGRRIACE